MADEKHDGALGEAGFVRHQIREGEALGETRLRALFQMAGPTQNFWITLPAPHSLKARGGNFVWSFYHTSRCSFTWLVRLYINFFFEKNKNLKKNPKC